MNARHFYRIRQLAGFEDVSVTVCVCVGMREMMVLEANKTPGVVSESLLISLSLVAGKVWLRS